ncbi:MAG: class II aldolase/adducin family protein [Candidatus Micrarchaeota archaeon]
MEEYIGVKFSVKEGALKEGRVDDARVREIVHWARVLSGKGFTPGNAGNISFRKGKGFVITSSGSELSNLGEDDFVFVEGFKLGKFELEGAIGMKLPSSETPLHAAIYSVRADVGAVVHCHAFPNGVVESEREFEYGGREQARAVSELLRENDIAIVRGHGAFSVGNNVEEAAGRILQSIKGK